jgi:hypothetical protein
LGTPCGILVSFALFEFNIARKSHEKARLGPTLWLLKLSSFVRYCADTFAFPDCPAAPAAIALVDVLKTAREAGNESGRYDLNIS